MMLVAALWLAPQLIGMTSLPREGPGGLPVGGLSGVDRDKRTGDYYLISDDRSEHGPARLWRAAIDYDVGRAPAARLIEPIPLRTRTGGHFPPPGTGAEASDGEAIRVAPDGQGLVWSSEGDRKDGFGPAVRLAARDGRWLRDVPLPPMFRYDPGEKGGPRLNLSIEGLSFDGRHLWIGLEAPLFQDGPLAASATGADVRLSRIDPKSGRLERQYAYPVEPIGPVPAGRLADNGVSEILAIDARHILVVERSGIQQPDGDFRYHARLWCASTDGASQVGTRRSLQDRAYTPLRKRLVFDFSRSPDRIDSVEGMSWGKILSNGHASLVFVTDNDFSPQRENQLIFLDIGARRARAAAALCT
ncbi:esterase-like activity of phytase family protein [Sphingomonas sp. MMS24-J13]|uniref:esterase-like activity of phytase family protein n=1 Tax=Sphingomonas sp. MMS24-J13 TaxID=3238686 RepID=UPI00384C30EE